MSESSNESLDGGAGDLSVAAPTDAESFHAALAALVDAADERGVNVKGGWELDGELDSSSNYDVLITEVIRDVEGTSRGERDVGDA